MKDKKVVILLVSSVLLLIVFIYQGAYAYFSADVTNTGSRNTSIATKNLKDLQIIDGTTTSSNLMIPGESVTQTFQVKNENDMKLCFNLNWTNVANTFINTNDLRVSLSDGTNNIPLTLNTFPITNSTLASNMKINASTTNNYTLTVEYVETESDQTGDMGKKFSGTITGEIVECTPATETLEKLAQLNPSNKVNTPMTPQNGVCPTMNSETKELQITSKEDTASLLCEAEDDYGKTYYYRGNVTNNYVKFGTWQTDYYYGFANYSTNGIYTSLTDCETDIGSGNCTKLASVGDDMYWRIVRINGDGSIRMVYDGTEAYANIKNGGLTSNGIYRSIGERRFSVGAYSAAPTAYMRGSTNGSGYATDFNVMNNKNGVSSLVKETVDSWYGNNIDITIPSSTKKYSDYISLDSIYCNDKNLDGSTYNYFQVAFYHGINIDNSIPVRFTCVNTQGTVDSKNDAFTVSTKGNGALTYPSAILTIDEAIAAGYYEYPTTASPYLNTGISNWTMTPTYYDTADVSPKVSYFDTYAGTYSIDNLAGIRPVLSLKPDVEFASGDGTMASPFVVDYN